jgi:hypothetical protein
VDKLYASGTTCYAVASSGTDEASQQRGIGRPASKVDSNHFQNQADTLKAVSLGQDGSKLNLLNLFNLVWRDLLNEAVPCLDCCPHAPVLSSTL